MLTAPVTYAGGKHVVAPQIIDFIDPPIDEPFYDLCCGTGAISIELVNRGYDPEQIHMLDAGPWGAFWNFIGRGIFDLNLFQIYLDQIPKNPNDIQDSMKATALKPPDKDFIYIFLILQAASYGGKVVYIAGNSWKHPGFCSFWQSQNHQPIYPMRPMPDILFERVRGIVENMKGVHGYCQDIFNLIPTDGVVYIDPPYADTTKYGYSFDLIDYYSRLDVDCYVSEKVPLSSKSKLLLAERSTRGIKDGISQHQEWISKVR